MFRKPLVALLLSHPFELLVAGWGMITGIPIALGLLAPSTSTAKLSPAIYWLFGFLLGVGGISVMFGLIMFYIAASYIRQTLGMRIEQIGWTCVSAATMSIVVLIVAQQIPHAYMGGFLYLLIASSAICRAIALRDVIASYGRTLEEDDNDERLD